MLNAANEVAVDSFLKEKISFYQIVDSVCNVVEKMSNASKLNSLDEILECDKEARRLTLEILK